jgi:hypothetical protein
VPDVAVYATAKKLERPAYREGFDELFSVRITGTPPSMSGRSLAVERQLRDGREPEAGYN